MAGRMRRTSITTSSRISENDPSSIRQARVGSDRGGRSPSGGRVAVEEAAFGFEVADDEDFGVGGQGLECVGIDVESAVVGDRDEVAPGLRADGGLGERAA